MVQAPPVSELEKHNQEMASIGWRMQSLNGAADSLLKSAARLEEEMARETTYWDQVLAIKEKGWSLSRLPREKHTLGVRYGFAESYADFRNRGLAALRRDADGNVSLDRGLGSTGGKSLRVRILQQGKPVASSTKGSNDISEDDSVTKDILKARNSIFDEELHHELHREARNLVNQGVRCADGRVLLPYEKDKQIEIDLVSLEDESEDAEAPTGDSTIADAIVLSLRIFLCHAHRQTLHRRSRTPPPLLEAKPSRPIYALLKPIIEHFQHQSQLASLQQFLQHLQKTLSAANLSFSFDPPTSPYNLPATSNTSLLSTLLHPLTTPLHSTTTLHLPTATAVIETHTTLLPPHHSPTHTYTTPSQTPTHHPTLHSLTTQILHHQTLSLLHHTTAAFPTWHSSPTATLYRTQEKTQVTEKATISLSEESLNLKWWRGGGGGAGSGEGWRGVSWFAAADDHEGNGGGEKRAYDEVFKEEVDA